MSKPMRRSKTIWFNVATTLPLMLEALATNTGLIQPIVPAAAWPFVLAGITIGNIWLRIVTSEAVRPPKDDAEKPPTQGGG